MKWLYLAAGLLSLLISLAVTAPAAYVYAWSGGGDGTLRAAGISGSVWHGHAASLRSGAFGLSDVHWRLHALGLLGARLQFTLSGDTPGGHAHALVRIGAGGGDVEIHALRFAAPLADLTAAAGLAAVPLTGQVSARFTHIAVAGGRPVAATGTAALGEVRWILGEPALSLGAFEARIDTQPDGTIRARLETRPDSAVTLRGTATLSPAGQWQLDVNLRPAHGADTRITNLFAALGKPDADGWHHIVENGRL